MSETTVNRERGRGHHSVCWLGVSGKIKGAARISSLGAKWSQWGGPLKGETQVPKERNEINSWKWTVTGPAGGNQTRTCSSSRLDKG